MKNINDCLFIFWWLKSDIKIINEIGPNDREPIIKYLEEDLYVLQIYTAGVNIIGPPMKKTNKGLIEISQCEKYLTDSP